VANEAFQTTEKDEGTTESDQYALILTAIEQQKKQSAGRPN